jgi:hypothetical protein
VAENLNDGLYHVVPIEGATAGTRRWKVVGPGQDGSSGNDRYYYKENAGTRVASENRRIAERALRE